ncbi:MAG: aminotransferase class III-fold pyridoxal phosphate-dependent enzyme [Verrucomicrobia bacterium]|nr:aminotransferase class III-fold pyridoxal phosphate-dependent enzyme [Verrucomicrobiota bacterium]
MSTRKAALIDQLRDLLGELGGQDLSGASPSTSFLDLGLDSLFLTQAASGMKSRFGIKITFRQLLETLTSIDALATYLDEQLPCAAATPEATASQALPTPATPAPVARTQPPPTTWPVPSPPTLSAQCQAQQIQLSEGMPFVAVQASPNGEDALERIVQEQLRLMEQQLALLRQGSPRPVANLASAVTQSESSAPPLHQHPSSRHESACFTPQETSAAPRNAPPQADVAAPQAAAVPSAASGHGPFKQIDKTARGGLTGAQQSHLDWFIPRYLSKSPRSREYTERFRKRLADPRAVAGFKQNWKEMVYPIVSACSSGANLWDIDGNRWVDVTMGFGVALLGHSPAFITEAIRKQLDAGVEIGPQSPLAGEVAELICEFTGMERVTFCNTGSEAVMAALRICRTATGRQKIALFAGAYHGTFDEVLVKGARVKGEPKTLPIAPGVAPNLIESVVVLDYGTQESLDWIRQHADSLAAVLVETVQSRHPDLQPKAFLQELRRITAAAETPLIFDEVITGFRCHPGGAQQYFGIEADLATYGKIVGGGMPFGFIAGKSWLMDAFDGGQWQYGDDSFPPSGVTFFAGTFVRHPLAMAAAKAMLLHLRQEGPSLQATLAQRTDRMVGSLNDYFIRHEVPLRLEHFTSVWYPHWGPEVKHGSLIFYHLREKGLHIWEGRPCFLSTAHTAEDEAFIERAFKLSVAEMQSGGFLPGTSDPEVAREVEVARQGASAVNEAGSVLSVLPHSNTPAPTASSTGSPSTVIPLTEGQQEMWLSAQLDPEASGTSNACCVIHFEGPVDANALESAIQRAASRHEALRATFLEDGSGIQVRADIDARLDRHDLRNGSDSDRESETARLLERESSRLFSLSDGPLFHACLIEQTSERSVFVFTLNMIACDGWGINVVLEEIGEIYSALKENRSPELKPTVPLRAYVEWLSEPDQVAAAAESEAFWATKFQSLPRPLELPLSGPRPRFRTVAGARESLRWDRAFCQRIRDAARAHSSTPFGVLFAAYQSWLSKLTGQDDLVIGVPFAGQSSMGRPSIVSQCIHTLPVRAAVASDQSFAQLLRSQRSLILEAQENWNCSFGKIAQKLGVEDDPGRLPLVSVLFNIDPPMTGVRFAGLSHHIASGPRAHFQYDLGLNVVDEGDTMVAELDYNRDLFAPERIAAWLSHFHALLEASLTNPGILITELPTPPRDETRPQEANTQAKAPGARADGVWAEQGRPRRDRVAPRTATEKALAGIWSSLLQLSNVGIQDNFFELGGRSLKAVALFAEIERAFGRKLPLATLLKAPTIEQLAARLDDRSSADATASSELWRSLVPIQRLGAKPNLFLVHGAGGNVLLYQALAEHLAPDYPLFGLQSQGLDGKTPPLRSIEEMATLYLSEIRRVQPHGPYFLGGYCLGGTIAYEIAQQLRKEGETIALVALLDTYNFAVMKHPSPTRLLLQRLKFHLGNFARLRPRDMLAYLSEKLRVARDGEWTNLFQSTSNAKPRATPETETETALREPAVQESNDNACLAYRPKPYAGVLTLFRPEVNYDFYPDPLMGWGDLAKGGIRTMELLVNPHAMLVEPFVQELAVLIKSRVDAGLAASASNALRKAA